MSVPSSRRIDRGSRFGLLIVCPSCRLPIRRRHEFGTDGIPDCLLKNSIDFGHGGFIESPAEHVGDRRELLRASSTPQRNVQLAAIEYPAYRQMDHSPVEAFPCELVEPPHRVEILLEAWQSKFWIALPQVVAGETARCGHAAGQQASAQRAVGEQRDLLLSAIGEHVLLDCAFEQIVGRLSRMKWRDLAEFIHLRRAEVADADCANLAVTVQRADRLGSFGNRRKGIGPVHLIEIDDIRPKPAQRIFDFLDDPGLARIAKWLAVLPVESRLRGDDCAPAPTAGEGLADDLLRATESVDRRGIYEIDSAIERFPDR